MFSSLCSGVVLFLIFWGQLPPFLLLFFSSLWAVCFYVYHEKTRHRHGGFLAIDYHAQLSRLSGIPTGLKAFFSLGTLFICLYSSTLLVSGIVLVVMSFVTVSLGKTPFSYYFSLLLLPTSFILLSGIALLIEFSPTPLGHLDIPFFASYLAVTVQGQRQALAVILRAVASVTCLYMLSLSTPLHELIGTLRRSKIPSLFIELMYLIYHYIFVLLSSLHQLSAAASARLGYRDRKTSFKTGISIGRNLFLISFATLSLQYDAMESRCYTGDIRFLEKEYRWNPRQTGGVVVFLAALVLLSCYLKRG